MEGNHSRNVIEPSSKGDEMGRASLKHELVVLFVFASRVKKRFFFTKLENTKKKECSGVAWLVTVNGQRAHCPLPT